ncbi:MAG: hypothetical protein D3915_08515 [Candidatus Electrothrix sp. AU1_5]|nr:hypothetical protein [Candidatus Electrothrix sp. AX1]MCI5178675.1 hypothetical protein [Candidatus Electrothrix gigas]MCI5182419.1 hypothetical protein [Candidatus Electrothrix gigas]MCI5189046.1 hypothetical protein [Candidatus Electrothrix gigas]MCI5193160.1 hypothetical protein [Candidatus Electrothrix gigas]
MHLQVQQKEKLATIALRLRDFFKQKKSPVWIGGLFFLALMYLMIGFVSIENGHVGIIFAKFGSKPTVDERFIVEEGEKGYQREVLMPGMRFYWFLEPLWKYTITEEPFVKIPTGMIGVVNAKDGYPMLPGQILADSDSYEEVVENGKKVKKFKMGQKGPRLDILKPGDHPVNPAYLEVKQYPAVNIPEGSLGVLTRLYGDEPPQGTILVSKESMFRGIIRENLQPGTYYINPKAYKYEIVEAAKIEKGQVGIITKRVGRIPPEGTILVDAEDDFQGIQRQVLQPGMYYLNPYEKSLRIEEAVSVPDGHVGVQIAKTGVAKPVDQLLAKKGERGIQENTLPPGLYYLNPYATEVVNIDIRQQRYEMTYLEGQGDTQQNDAIVFYSDDGFEIAIDVTVLFQILPHDAPYVVATIGRNIQDIKEKIIRPQARSYARILGSRYKGEDFVHGATRETFQNDIHKELKTKSLESRVQMNQALVRHFEVPALLRQPITDKVIALKMQEKFEQEQKTQKANADLAREKEKVNFESAKVVAETKKIKAIISAEEAREVEEINVAKKEFIAQGEAKKIQIGADAALYEKEKEATGILAVGKAQAEAKKLILAAYNGEGGHRFAEVEKAKALGSGIEKIYYIPADMSINAIAKDFENAITVGLPDNTKKSKVTD